MSRYRSEYWQKNKLRFSVRLKKYRYKNRHKRRLYRQEYQKKFRIELLKLMGMKCVNCGYCKDYRALQIDHKKGGGFKDRKIMNGNQPKFYKILILLKKNNPKRFLRFYQLLCANCNWIKRYEQKECK